MKRIHYSPDEVEISAEPSETILGVSLRAGIPHTHVCGGNARCSTCRVMIVDGLEACDPRNLKEQAMAERLHFAAPIRLACQTTFQGNIRLRRLVLDDEDITLTEQKKGDAESKMVGEEKAIAILFSDIRGFTAFSEKLPPYDVIHTLNRYFHRMGEVVTRHGGYIDNYIGDGMMALFGVEDAEGAALAAVKAGLDMLDEVERFKVYMEHTYKHHFEIGIGVHFGEAVVGTIGASNRKKETAIGDTVNFASRIESANKEAGTHFLISETVYQQVKDQVDTGKEVRLDIKGKTGKYMLYEALRLKSEQAERPGGIRIMDLRPGDEQAVQGAAGLLVSAFREHWPDAWPTIEEALAEVREMTAEDRICRVALDERGEVVGWVGGIPEYDGKVWELHPMAVRPDRQGQGIGRRLVADFEAQVAKRGGLTIQLGTDDVDNMTSLSGVDLYTNLSDQIANIRNLRRHPYAFYQKLGYTIIGVMPDANGPG
ncbi:MAG: GNAT family N-acetyltransferase, partial [Anaerolineae bacterium]|nr:GNAT family N-acetyltransferase [Anaerolineae bacterium]